MEFMSKGDKKLKSFSLFGNKKEEALELYQKGAVRARAAHRDDGDNSCHGDSCDDWGADPVVSSADLLQASEKVAGGGRRVSWQARATRPSVTQGRYQKCAEMMLEMKQTHDACSSFLEAAVRHPAAALVNITA